MEIPFEVVFITGKAGFASTMFIYYLNSEGGISLGKEVQFYLDFVFDSGEGINICIGHRGVLNTTAPKKYVVPYP